jgi:hypothetical protein
MHKFIKMVALLVLTLVYGSSVSTDLQAQSSGPGKSAQDILKQAADYLKSSQNLEIEADIEFDVLLTPTLVAQYSGELEVKLSRPDGLFVAYRDHSQSRKLWFDGKELTYLDVLTGHFALEPGKATVEETVFELHQRYGLALPLSDLLFSRMPSGIFGNAHSADYLGLISISGATVHHIVAHSENADVQVWIESGGRPVIRKMVIINHHLPFAPRYSAKFTKFERREQFSASPFLPVLPEKSYKTKILANEGRNTNAHAN